MSSPIATLTLSGRKTGLQSGGLEVIGPYTIIEQVHDKLYVVQNNRTSTQMRVLVKDIRPLY